MATHKVIITGTGRAGTTFLVELLTRLGLDTGYSSETLTKDPVSRAGLEQPGWERSDSPYIVKSPLIAGSLHYAMRMADLVIDHALIPMRPLREVVASRARVREAGGSRPGGPMFDGTREEQACEHARQFHQLMMAVARYGIPHTLLEFPRLVEDEAYCFRKLAPVLQSTDAEHFTDAFAATAQRSLVHRFDSAD